MKIFLQPETKHGEDYETAEELQQLLEQEFLQHSNIAEECIEIIIMDNA